MYLNIFFKILVKNKLNIIVLICFILSVFNYIKISNFKFDNKIACNDNDNNNIYSSNNIVNNRKRSSNNNKKTHHKINPNIKTTSLVNPFSIDNSNKHASSLLKFPHVLDGLPHLAKRSTDSFLPEYELSRHRKSKYVIGIPTVKREEPYLEKMLLSFFESFKKKPDGLNQVLIVIQISELNDTNFINETIRMIQNLYKKEIKAGIIDLIVPPKEFYPDLQNLNVYDDVFNDDPKRIAWRVKQIFDVSYLMN